MILFRRQGMQLCLFEHNKFVLIKSLISFIQNHNPINYLTFVNQNGVFGPNYALMIKDFFLFKNSKHLMI